MKPASKKTPPVLAVCGVKNSGKTSLLLGLIPRLRALGLKVVVIKHDGHDYEPDVPGTDSFRLRQAGAGAVAVYSAARWSLCADQPGVGPEDLLTRLPETDLVIVEGGKFSPYPKIEVLRAAVSREPAADPATVIAFCTDLPVFRQGLPHLPLDDYDGLARFILARFFPRHEPAPSAF